MFVTKYLFLILRAKRWCVCFDIFVYAENTIES